MAWPGGRRRVWGFFIHPVLATDSETEAVPGLLDAGIWTRTGDFVAAPVRARALEDKGSIRWLDGAVLLRRLEPAFAAGSRRLPCVPGRW